MSKRKNILQLLTLSTTTHSVKTAERQHTLEKLRQRRTRPAQSAIDQMYELFPVVTSGWSTASEEHPTHNEDALLIDETTGLFAVFDGVGGSEAAEIASQTAVQATTQTWHGWLRPQPRRRKGYAWLVDRGAYDLSSLVEKLVLEADEQVRTEGAQRAGTHDLSTTVALAAFCKQPGTHHYTMVSAHVGDSRIYLLRGQEYLQRLTSDDGFLTKLIGSKMINQECALHIDQAMREDELTDLEKVYFRLRGGITQALGNPVAPMVHTNQTTVKPGDRVLLCTDGIHDNLTDEEIESTLRNSPRTACARVLVERSRERSREDFTRTIRAKPDDMSAIVLTCRF
jgi:serine/threonine protein phosphatase PrpC